MARAAATWAARSSIAAPVSGSWATARRAAVVSRPVTWPRTTSGCTAIARTPDGSRKRWLSGTPLPPGKCDEVPGPPQLAIRWCCSWVQLRSADASGPAAWRTAQRRSAPIWLSAALSIPETSMAPVRACSWICRSSVRAVRLTTMRANRWGSGTGGIPPVPSIIAPSRAAESSSMATISAGRVVVDSTLIAPTTCPCTQTGTQASATSPGIAAMKSGSRRTSSSTTGSPVRTTRPMIPVSVLKPSTTWKYPRAAWHRNRPSTSR